MEIEINAEKIKNHPRVEIRNRLMSLHKITKGSYLKYKKDSLYLMSSHSNSFGNIPIAKLITDFDGDSYIKFNDSGCVLF